MRTLTLLLFLFFQGCVSVPKDEIEQALPAPVSFSHALQEALKTPVFQEGDWPKENWWEIFNDPVLSGYISRALVNSPTMKQAEAQVEIAKQIAQEKRGILFPDLSFNPQTQWQHLSKNGLFRSLSPAVPPVINDMYVTFDSQWDLDLFGRNKELYYAALDRYRAEEAEKADVRLFLSAAVAKTYFELQANLERLSLLKKTQSKRRMLVDLSTARRKNSLNNEIHLLEPQANLLQLERDLFTVQTEIFLNEHLLRVLMGEGPDSPSPLEVHDFPWKEPIPLPSDLSADLLARRPDLMAQIWRVEAAAKEIGAAKASFYPNINLLAFAGFESLHFHNLFSWSSKTISLSPAIHLPIFTGGRLKAKLREKRAEFQSAVAAYHEQLLSAAKEVVDQLTMLNFLDKQQQIQELTVDNLAQHSELTYQRYRKGISAYMNALEVEERFIFEEMQLIDIELSQRQACVNLVKALGGGYHLTPPLSPKGVTRG
jgi:NodT family efflux transporter outer membrane factor (OMF) lipoprotein